MWRTSRSSDNVADKFTRFRNAAGNMVGAPLVLDPQFNPFGLAAHTAEISDVLPRTAYMAAAATVQKGQKTRDHALIHKPLKIGEGVAYQTYTNQNSGYAFA